MLTSTSKTTSTNQTKNRPGGYTGRKENEMKNILEVARLIRVLESNDSKEAKVKQIKLVRDNGDITSDEALDLAIEYFTK